jgi:hypothetical protein
MVAALVSLGSCCRVIRWTAAPISSVAAESSGEFDAEDLEYEAN